jgi:uncharacterized protein YggE
MRVNHRALNRVGATVLLATAFGALSTASAAAASGTQSSGTTIETSGMGSASATPDMMTFVACVNKQESTASAAQTAANDAAAQLKTALENAGIAESDFGSTNYSAGPDYNYNVPPGSQPQLTGYHVSNCVPVALHDLSKAGSVLDTATSAVGDTGSVSSVEFSLSDPTPLDQNARTTAYADAKAKALQYAQSAGMTACLVDSIVDGNSSSPSPFRVLAMPAASGSVPVSLGQVQRTVNIDLVLRCY